MLKPPKSLKRIFRSKRILYSEDGEIICIGSTTMHSKFKQKQKFNNEDCYLLKIAFRPEDNNGVVNNFRNKTVTLREYYSKLIHSEIPESLAKYADTPAQLQIVNPKNKNNNNNNNNNNNAPKDRPEGFIHLGKNTDIIIYLDPTRANEIQGIINRSKISTKNRVNRAKKGLENRLRPMTALFRFAASTTKP